MIWIYGALAFLSTTSVPGRAPTFVCFFAKSLVIRLPKSVNSNHLYFKSLMKCGNALIALPVVPGTPDINVHFAFPQLNHIQLRQSGTAEHLLCFTYSWRIRCYLSAIVRDLFRVESSIKSFNQSMSKLYEFA